MNIILFTIINNAFNLLQMLIMVRVFLSWIPHDPYNQFLQILYAITDTILKPIREFLPVQAGGLDFSPMIAFVLLGFIKNLFISVI